MSKAKSSPALLVYLSCGAFGTIECFANDADARAVAELLAKLPAEVAPALLRYMRLFKPAKSALTWKKARAILEVLSPLVVEQNISRNGRVWEVPHGAWAPAVDRMLENKNLDLPMKSHGYLFEILVGDVNKEEAKAERQQDAEIKAASQERRARILAVEREIDSINNMLRERSKPLLTREQAATYWQRAGLEQPPE